jgi:hypothetical protein
MYSDRRTPCKSGNLKFQGRDPAQNVLGETEKTFCIVLGINKTGSLFYDHISANMVKKYKWDTRSTLIALSVAKSDATIDKKRREKLNINFIFICEKSGGGGGGGRSLKFFMGGHIGDQMWTTIMFGHASAGLWYTGCLIFPFSITDRTQNWTSEKKLHFTKPLIFWIQTNFLMVSSWSTSKNGSACKFWVKIVILLWSYDRFYVEFSNSIWSKSMLKQHEIETFHTIDHRPTPRCPFRWKLWSCSQFLDVDHDKSENDFWAK